MRGGRAVPAPAAWSCRPRRCGAGSPRRGTGRGTPACSVSRDVERDRRADELQQHERRHRQAQRVERAVGDLERGALVDAAVTSPRNRVSSRLTTNAGASLTSTHDFFSALPTAKAVASVASSVCSARTISSSGITATGLKKWKPTTRSGCCEVRGHLGHRQRGGVGGRTQVSEHDGLDLGEDLLLDLEVLEHGLDDEVGVGERRPWSIEPVTRALSRLALSGVEPALGAAACRSRRGRRPRPCRPAPGRGRSARPAPRRRCTNSSASWLAISPAPTTPTLVTGRASVLSGAPAGRLARCCTRSNEYSPARSSSPMMRSASASSSAAKPSSRVAVLAAAIRSSARYGAGAAPCSLASTSGAALRRRRRPRPRRGRPRARSTATSPVSDVRGPAQRLLEEVGRLEQRVGDARGPARPGRLEHAGSGSAGSR